MFEELSKAFVLVFSAEMGDKSQLLALAFATRYPMKKVLSGMFLGILLNHSLAVFLGSLFSRWGDPVLIQWIAGLAFLAFALWSLKPDEGEEEQDSLSASGSVVMTIALAFFIGELGDKTQLTAITLAAQTQYPLIVLCGTMSAMLTTGLIGIVLGKKLGKQVPELFIKLLAAFIFALFGWMKLYSVLPQTLRLPAIALFAVVFLWLGYRRVQFERSGRETAFARKAEQLKQFYDELDRTLDETCLHCADCEGEHCYVGHTRSLVKGAETPFAPSEAARSKTFEEKRIEQMRASTRGQLKSYPQERRLKHILDTLEQVPKK